MGGGGLEQDVQVSGSDWEREKKMTPWGPLNHQRRVPAGSGRDSGALLGQVGEQGRRTLQLEHDTLCSRLGAVQFETKIKSLIFFSLKIFISIFWINLVKKNSTKTGLVHVVHKLWI